MARSGRHAYRIWSNPERRFLKSPPGRYHSTLPSDDDVQQAFCAAESDQLPGLKLDDDGQMALLQQLAPFAREWPFPSQPEPGFRHFSENGYCLKPDGVVLYAMLRHFQPARVLEVGSGFSSALMLDTNEQSLGGKTTFTFIDPDPTRLNKLMRTEDRVRCNVLSVPVQKVSLSVFEQLQAGDLLYVDSSHVSKAGSDINYLFLQVLPRLAPGVLVQVHDIFWPFEYPREWYAQGIAWNEAYFVRAFLMFNIAFQVLLWLPGLYARCPERISAIWPDPKPCNGEPSSLWMVRAK